MSRPCFFPPSKTIIRTLDNERLKHLEEDTVKWASEQMIKVLAKNRKKGGWRHCTFEYLRTRLFEEYMELLDAVEKYQRDKRTKPKAIKEAVDVMNIAMMIADIINQGKAG